MVKGQIRSKKQRAMDQAAAANCRDVRQATVGVTNPTAYAVALQYERAWLAKVRR